MTKILICVDFLFFLYFLSDIPDFCQGLWEPIMLKSNSHVPFTIFTLPKFDCMCLAKFLLMTVWHDLLWILSWLKKEDEMKDNVYF